MTSDKIIISFDDDGDLSPDINKDHPDSNDKNKIEIIDFNPYGCSGFFKNSLKYPTGIEQGFSRKYCIELNEIFLAPILAIENQLVVTAKTGEMFFVDFMSGDITDKKVIKGQSFETGGITFNSRTFIPSAKKLFMITGNMKTPEVVFEAEDGFLLWTNLEISGDEICFLLYSPKKNIVKCCSFGIETGETTYNTINEVYACSNKIFASDEKIILGLNGIISIFNKTEKKIIFGSEVNTEKPSRVNDQSCLFTIIGNRLIWTAKGGEIYYVELMSGTDSPEIRFSGIRAPDANTITGFGDNIFIGTLFGWECRKYNGVKVYSHYDSYEVKPEAMNNEILIASKRNKVVFHNINNFAAAEGFSISKDETDYVVSSVFIGDRIYILSKTGILSSFSNDRLNITI